jgi:hypothetical protein
VDFDSAAIENIGENMSVEALISTQVIDTTSVGRSVMTAADAAAVRTAADAQVTLVSGTNIKTVNSTSLLGSGDIAVGVSGTGAVDNAALRADGTGGATLQSSAFVIADNGTASPNNTVNHASIQATGGTTNVSVSIVPKGTGSFSLRVPDGTATGGNVRGANAVDLQTSRALATQVASGQYSIVGGFSSTSSARCTVAFGYECVASGSDSVSIGMRNTTSGVNSTAIGRNCSASAEFAVALGGYNSASSSNTLATGLYSSAVIWGMMAHAAGAFSVVGDAQRIAFVLRRKTTDATATTLMLDGSGTRLTITSGKVMSVMCRICGIKSDGSAVANYVRRVVIKKVGGTTSLVGAVETIGTDIEDNALTDVAITADDTNDALQINVTGIAAETWRWVAVVEGLEIAYGT